jgi:hypothetical protein
MCSHGVPQDIPNSNLIIIPYGLPKVRLSCIETEKVGGKGAHLFLFFEYGP